MGATTASGDAVRFDLMLPNAVQEVALVGDFNGWDEHATPMVRRRDDGAWSAKVPLSPGRHVYAFVIDGRRWLVDPLAPQVPDGGYGPATQGHPRPFGMPPAVLELDDRDIAAVLTHLRTRWGNQASEVTPLQVNRIRAAQGQ